MSFIYSHLFEFPIIMDKAKEGRIESGMEERLGVSANSSLERGISMRGFLWFSREQLN